MKKRKKSSLYNVKEIGKEYNEEMLRILKESPIESGGLQICFDREPDIFFIPELDCDFLKCAGFFRKNELLGFAMLVYKKMYVNGEPQTVMNFCNMYVKKAGRYKGYYFRSSEFFFKRTYQNSKLGYTINMVGNTAAESHINRRNPRYPYVPFSKVISYLDVKNIIITFRKKENPEYHIRHANEQDVPTIVSFLTEEFSNRLFGPVMNKEKIMKNLKTRPGFKLSNYYIAEKDNEPVGLCSVWDTSDFKKNRIIKYGKKFRLIKIVYSILCLLFGFPPLPKEGDAFKDVTITEYAVKGRDPKIMKALLLKIYNEYRDKKYNMIIFGSCYTDPLLQATKSFFTQSVMSNIVLASPDETQLQEDKIDTTLPFVNVALL
jgi:hypothetical protein